MLARGFYFALAGALLCAACTALRMGCIWIGSGQAPWLAARTRSDRPRGSYTTPQEQGQGDVRARKPLLYSKRRHHRLLPTTINNSPPFFSLLPFCGFLFSPPFQPDYAASDHGERLSLRLCLNVSFYGMSRVTTTAGTSRESEAGGKWGLAPARDPVPDLPSRTSASTQPPTPFSP